MLDDQRNHLCDSCLGSSKERAELLQIVGDLHARGVATLPNFPAVGIVVNGAFKEATCYRDGTCWRPIQPRRFQVVGIPVPGTRNGLHSKCWLHLQQDYPALAAFCHDLNGAEPDEPDPIPEPPPKTEAQLRAERRKPLIDALIPVLAGRFPSQGGEVVPIPVASRAENLVAIIDDLINIRDRERSGVDVS